jgi:hypothetical protein
MLFVCRAVSRSPEFRPEFRDVTNNEWHTTNDVTSCNTCNHRADVAPRYCIVRTSWNSGALETAAQQWGLSPDQHFVWSDIFITRQIGILGCAIFRAFSHIFHKNTHPSMIKSVGDFISTQKNSLSTLCVILEGFAHILFANCCPTDQCM